MTCEKKLEEININSIDELFASQSQASDLVPWNKVERSIKLRKLFQYAEKYATETAMNPKNLKSLKMFFTSSLNKGRLLKTKEVTYNVDTGIIDTIPGLQYNTNTKNFTIRNVEPKHVSTVKIKQKKPAAKIKVEPSTDKIETTT
jgi:hypothetical protein